MSRLTATYLAPVGLTSVMQESFSNIQSDNESFDVTRDMGSSLTLARDESASSDYTELVCSSSSLLSTSMFGDLVDAEAKVKPLTPSFQFNLHADEYVPTSYIIRSQPLKEPKSVKRYRLKPMPTPIFVPQPCIEDVRNGIREFISIGRQVVDKWDIPVHPAIIRSQAYGVRKLVNEKVKHHGTNGNDWSMVNSPSDKAKARSPRKERRRKANVVATDTCDDPFALEVKRRTAAVSSPCYTRRQNEEGSSPWSLELRSKFDAENPTLMKYTRQLKSLLNKLSTANADCIIFERIIPLLIDYRNEVDYDDAHVFNHMANAMIVAVSNDPSKSILFGQCTYAIIQFTLQLDNKDPSLFRDMLVQLLHTTFTCAENALTSAEIVEQDLEVINYKKDTLRALSNYSWSLTSRGILPSRVLRRCLEVHASHLTNDIVEYDRLALLLISSMDHVHHLGGTAHEKCDAAVNSISTVLRTRISEHMPTWSIPNRRDATRMLVLIEIAEAERDHRSRTPSSICYPLRVQEAQHFIAKYHPS